MNDMSKPAPNAGLGGFCAAMAAASLLIIGFLVQQSWGQDDMKVSIGVLIGTIGVVALVSLIGLLFYAISHITHRHNAGVRKPV